MSGIILAVLMIFGGFAGAFLHHEYREITEKKPKTEIKAAPTPEKHVVDVTVHVDEEDNNEVRQVQ